MTKNCKLRLARETVAAMRRAATAVQGGITHVEFAWRVLNVGVVNPYPLDASTRSEIVRNLVDLDPEDTDLYDKEQAHGSLHVEASALHVGAAILEAWCYSGRANDYTEELEDTVYVGVVDGRVVGPASCRFEVVKAAVQAAIGGTR